MKSICILCCFLFSFLLSNNAAGQPGSLDVLFGNEGKIIIDDDWVWSTSHTCIMQPDGKILVAGRSFFGNLSYSWSLYRYLDNGQSDLPFGNEGCVGQGYVGSAGPINTALQSDQKIVELGYWGVESVIKRWNTDGTPDMSFGTNGEVLSGAIGVFNAMEILQNDKIVLAGQSYENQSWMPSVVCLEADGNPDQSFGKDGSCIIPDTTIQLLFYSALQTDNKILVLGHNYDGNRFIIARISIDGIIDSTFGLNGILTYQFWSGNLEPYEMITDPADNVLITGAITTTNGSHPFLMRLTLGGLLDSSFNETGFLSNYYGDTDFEYWNTIAVEKDKKILVGGSSGDSLLLCSFFDDGSIDTSFGNSGVVKDYFGGAGTGIGEICIQEDGKLVAAGSSDGNHMVLRYNTELSIGLNEHKTEIFFFNIYPNPLQNQAMLEYTLKKETEVAVSLLNIFGQTVAVFIDSKIREAGPHTESLNFNSSHSPGMYFVKITCNNESKLIKCEIF